VRHFIQKFARRMGRRIETIPAEAMEALVGYPWPGNIRELENVIGYACMMTESDSVDVRDLPDYLQASDAPGREDEALLSMRSMELLHLHRVLEHVGGNRGKAAEILEISRTTLYRLLEEEKKNGQASLPSPQIS